MPVLIKGHRYYFRYHGLALILSFFLCCKNDPAKITKTINRDMVNEERAEEVTILYSKEGNTKAKLFTNAFQHIQNTNPTYIEMSKGLRVEFFNDSMQVQSTMTAKYGKYFEQNGNVLVRDSVVVTNLKKEQLNTEELVWNEKMQKFFTEKFVKITTPTQIIYGDGLESNQNFSEYKIINIKGMIGVTPKALPTISSKFSTGFLKHNLKLYKYF